MATKITSTYQSKTDVNLEAPMICGRTGIRKKFKDLTDVDVKAMIDKGSTFFEAIPVVAKVDTTAATKS